MVKLGFIVEGASEKTILKSDMFRSLLAKLGLDFVEPIIDAKGGGNLLPEHLQNQVILLEAAGATQIIILTDQEDAPCISSVKARINPYGTHIVIIAVKTLESWFLADTAAISTYMQQYFRCEFPEKIAKPFQFIKEEKFRLTDRGVNDKLRLCSHMLLNGFSIEAAAAHPNCPSARYFLQKLQTIASAKTAFAK